MTALQGQNLRDLIDTVIKGMGQLQQKQIPNKESDSAQVLGPCA